MLVRLAFAVMIQVDAEILLIDEVLAVGDAAFQQKCFDEFVRIRDGGPDDAPRHARHGRGASASATGRVLLEKGRVRRDGDAHRVGNRYLEVNFGRRGAPRKAAEGVVDPSASATARAEILEAWFEDERGAAATMLQRRPCAFAARVRFRRRRRRTRCSASCSRTPHARPCCGRRRRCGRSRSSGRFAAGDEVVFRVALRERPRARAATTRRPRSRCGAAAPPGSTGASGSARSSSPARARPTRSSSCPTRRRSSARRGATASGASRERAAA